MSKTFEQGKEEVSKLCHYFSTNREVFLAPGIKEAHIRQTLIDPFFEALGWDVRNAEMKAPQYREVIPEDSLEVEGHQKAPDYTFRIGPMPLFYVEAKTLFLLLLPGHLFFYSTIGPRPLLRYLSKIRESNLRIDTSLANSKLQLLGWNGVALDYRWLRMVLAWMEIEAGTVKESPLTS